MPKIRESRIVDCPFSGVIEYAERFFEHRHKLRLTGLQTIKTEVTTEYNVVIDHVDAARRHDALEISWSPNEHVPLPAFHGMFSVRPDFKGSLLTLEGAYEPPLGKVGKAFDKAAGRSIARGTLNGLLQEVKISVEEQWNQERRGLPNIETLNKRQNSSTSKTIKKKSH